MTCCKWYTVRSYVTECAYQTPNEKSAFDWFCGYFDIFTRKFHMESRAMVCPFGNDTFRSQKQSFDNTIDASMPFTETTKNTKTLYCFLTRGFPNIKCVPCIQTGKSLVGNQLNLTALKEVPLLTILTSNICSNFSPEFLSICKYNS